MPVIVPNFAQSALRVAISPTDNQLLLTPGTGYLFNGVIAGNFCFVTVNDGTSVEIMKYVSSGPVVNDTLAVIRAQDNTTAKSFPVGSCVAVGWNVEQVTDLIDQEVVRLGKAGPTGPTGPPGVVSIVVGSIVNLRLVNHAVNTEALVTGYYAAGDGGGGLYYYDAADTTSSDNGGTIIVAADSARWKLQYTGFVSVKQFGSKLDNVSDDSATLAAAITAGIAQNFKIYAPPGIAYIGTTTLVFPASMQDGFVFESDPGFVLRYIGHTDVVYVDSCYHSKIILGQLLGVASTLNGIHIAPSGTNNNGEVAAVVSEIGFQFIGAVKTGIFYDCNLGNIAQLNINGIEINSGKGLPAGAQTGNVYALNVDGVSPHICQGCVTSINYLRCTETALAGGARWTAIKEGSAGFGPSLVNVNTWKYGAIDGAGFTNSYGVDTYAGYAEFHGPIVDVQIGIQLEVGSFQNTFYTADVNILGGGTRFNDLTGGVYGAYFLVAPQGWVRNTGWRIAPDGYLFNFGETAQSPSIAAGDTFTFLPGFALPFQAPPTSCSATLKDPTGNSYLSCFVHALTTTTLSITVTNLHTSLAATTAVCWSAEGF